MFKIFRDHFWKELVRNEKKIHMKKVKIKAIIILFAIFFGFNINAQLNYQEAVSDILENYPKATLIDIYKSFFQDKFGPEHIVSDTLSVRNYLRNELQNMGETAMPLYEPAGNGTNFIRVSLELIRDSVIKEEDLLYLFIESANSKRNGSVAEWRDEWEVIKSYVPANINGYAEDSEKIDSILALGKYAVHHSAIYNELYHPHYRIIQKELFEKHILPRLKKK